MSRFSQLASSHLRKRYQLRCRITMPGGGMNQTLEPPPRASSGIRHAFLVSETLFRAGLAGQQPTVSPQFHLDAV